MPSYQTTVASPWSADRAFDYLVDLEHFADWDPGVKRATRAPASEPGTAPAFDVTVGGVGRDLTLRYEVVAADRPRRFEARAETGTLRSVDVITVAAEPGGGSRVTYDADLSFKGVLRVGNPLLGLAFRRLGDRAAEGLRAKLAGAPR
jgi:carbon monoxide dehydrogenase subunit G